MKTWKTDEQGISSVLIVIMMIVLMLFGVAGLTLAMSNNRLADKKIDWLNDYYQLEGDANQTIAKINSAIKDAANETDLLSAIDTLNDETSLAIVVNNVAETNLKLSFTAEKKGEYSKYIDVVLNIIKDAHGQYSLITEQFKQHQAPFEYGSLFDFE